MAPNNTPLPPWSLSMPFPPEGQTRNSKQSLKHTHNHLLTASIIFFFSVIILLTNFNSAHRHLLKCYIPVTDKKENAPLPSGSNEHFRYFKHFNFPFASTLTSLPSSVLCSFYNPVSTRSPRLQCTDCKGAIVPFTVQ